MKTREQLVNFHTKRLEKVKASCEGIKGVDCIKLAENELQEAIDGKLDYCLTSNILKTFKD